MSKIEEQLERIISQVWEDLSHEQRAAMQQAVTQMTGYAGDWLIDLGEGAMPRFERMTQAEFAAKYREVPPVAVPRPPFQPPQSYQPHRPQDGARS